MRDELSEPVHGSPVDPFAMARRDMKKALPRRFWRETAVGAREGGFGVDLDGRPARTPGKAVLTVSSPALAEALAAEWEAQTEEIDPTAMPLTRIVNTALDGVAQAVTATVAATAKFAETDLICYRAGEPEALVAKQAEAWDPILAFVAADLGARFVCAEGVMYRAQPEEAVAAVGAAVARLAEGPEGTLRLTAFSFLASLLGSVLLTHALAAGHIDIDDAWRRAHVDEDHQMNLWGRDEEALARREVHWRDARAAARILALTAG